MCWRCVMPLFPVLCLLLYCIKSGLFRTDVHSNFLTGTLALEFSRRFKAKTRRTAALQTVWSRQKTLVNTKQSLNLQLPFFSTPSPFLYLCLNLLEWKFLACLPSSDEGGFHWKILFADAEQTTRKHRSRWDVAATAAAATSLPTVTKVTALRLMTDDMVTYLEWSTTAASRLQTEINTRV